MGWLISVAVSLFLSFLVGKGAQNQKRNFWLWFGISVITTPLIGFLGIMLLPRRSASGYIED
ncbi:MAG: hypothetical protein ACOC4I_03745 [Spirochaetota bacterium]